MLYFIPTPIGNIQDITLRSLELIESADIVFCEDTRVTKKLLALLDERYGLKHHIQKFYSLHSHNEESVIKNLDIEMFEKNVLYLSDAGMPCISDPGVKLIQYAQQNGIEYEVLPGANAAVAAYASSGFDEKEFLFFGFLPHKSNERKTILQDILGNGYNTILYEAPHRIKKLIDEINDIDSHRELFVQKEISKLHQKWFKDSAKNIAKLFENENLKGEWVVVIKANKLQTSIITKDDILSLQIPKKQKAKLLSKITGESVKEIYGRLVNE
jgi:16S rRNA (cytidine1402-2'-O)-methyltransferase